MAACSTAALCSFAASLSASLRLAAASACRITPGTRWRCAPGSSSCIAEEKQLVVVLHALCLNSKPHSEHFDCCISGSNRCGLSACRQPDALDCSACNRAVMAHGM